MEEESIADANNVTVDIFSYASSAKRENENAIFTSKKLEKLYELVDAVKNLTINDAKYYKSNTATVSNAQGNLTSNPETVTHTSKNVFEQKLLISRTIPVFPLLMNPGIAEIGLKLPTLLMHVMKEIFVDVASGGAWKSRTSWQVSRTSINGSNPCDIGNSIGIVETSSPDLIVIIRTAPPCGLNLSLKVGDIWKSTYPEFVRQPPKLDAAIDGKLSDNCDAMSIFSKAISDKLSAGSSWDLYTHFRMNLMAYPVQNQKPQFVGLGISNINALDKGSGLITHATRIRRPTYGSH